MIEKIWSGNSWLYILLIPFSILYGIIIKLRNISYNIGISNTWKAPIPIVVVGNLTVGGNGKTPFVIWLVKKLSSKGYHVGVVSRGYSGKAKFYPILVNKNFSVKEIGDEPALIYLKTGVPVSVSPKRVKAVKILLKRYPKLDLIISDDGLQHYALKRDYEIVIIDGMRYFGNGWLLPAGPLRECQYRLNTVNSIIINGSISQYGAINMELIGNIAINLLSGEKKHVLELKEVVVIAGIGNPLRFFSSLKEKGVKLIKTHSFSDHKNYKLSQLKKIATNSQILLMTEKDAVKCFNFAQLNWWYLPVNVKISKFDVNKILSDMHDLINLNKNV
ncbi:tetraacyldisaccharide 4'-kinase [Arsenophonus symbiont of Ornithomya chloropus]|uniref:tetraacyldisaccharide 4'-kinase n=1 Tax=Arsenophonus symbiont of Ornithomya chloropus TaxID=634121 RepID=UPI0032B24F9F